MIKFSHQALREVPVIGIMRGFESEQMIDLAHFYFEAGFTTLEVTMNTPSATETIQKLVREFPDRNLGAGTVISMEDLEAALEAGASFIVTPVLVESVIRACVERSIPILPGALTPTEINQAWTWGATAVKIFPATLGGLSYIRQVRAALDQIEMVPTGGVAIDNVQDFLKSGVFAVGVGSGLFPRDKLGNPQEMKQHLQQFRNACQMP